ncbi:MAG: DnaJ domain-containing protein [Gammaproteobacteria bacterium]|nr:DnaJ domain-containing protein [Gammaproteobacteria bacterium]
MPDLTQLIEQSFFAPVEAFLAEHPEGVEEFEFLRHLDEQGVFQALDTGVDPSLLLFQKHFLLFHVLYSINRQRVADKQGALQISPMMIKPLDYVEAGTQIGELDSLSRYYLALDNLAAATEDSVSDLLDAFWVQYLKNDKRGNALKVLGLNDPVTDTKIVQRYRKLVSVHHPDKGGNKDEIQAINEAYAALIRP